MVSSIGEEVNRPGAQSPRPRLLDWPASMWRRYRLTLPRDRHGEAAALPGLAARLAILPPPLVAELIGFHLQRATDDELMPIALRLMPLMLRLYEQDLKGGGR